MCMKIINVSSTMVVGGNVWALISRVDIDFPGGINTVNMERRIWHPVFAGDVCVCVCLMPCLGSGVCTCACAQGPTSMGLGVCLHGLVYLALHLCRIFVCLAFCLCRIFVCLAPCLCGVFVWLVTQLYGIGYMCVWCPALDGICVHSQHQGASLAILPTLTLSMLCWLRGLQHELCWGNFPRPQRSLKRNYHIHSDIIVNIHNFTLTCHVLVIVTPNESLLIKPTTQELEGIPPNTAAVARIRVLQVNNDDKREVTLLQVHAVSFTFAQQSIRDRILIPDLLTTVSLLQSLLVYH